jgi:hypothetical protein
MNLAEIYDEYLQSMSIEKVRDPERLFVTDVGSCTRRVALRMKGAARTPATKENRSMWDLAEYIEETLMKALDCKGLLCEYQAPINIIDRDNWGGRLDIVRYVSETDKRTQIVEVKTERSNALARKADGTLSKPHPKPNHVMQATIYDHYYDYEGEHLDPVLWYAARGGSNPSLECDVTPEWEPIVALMDELEAVRKALPELPPMLPKQPKLTSYDKVLKYAPDYRCSYCDYRGVSCFPDMSEPAWATDGPNFRFTAKADKEVIAEWALAEAKDALLAAL